MCVKKFQNYRDFIGKLTGFASHHITIASVMCSFNVFKISLHRDHAKLRARLPNLKCMRAMHDTAWQLQPAAFFIARSLCRHNEPLQNVFVTRVNLLWFHLSVQNCGDMFTNFVWHDLLLAWNPQFSSGSGCPIYGGTPILIRITIQYRSRCIVKLVIQWIINHWILVSSKYIAEPTVNMIRCK